MKNLSFLHSPIVYSTGISTAIKWYYKRWATEPEGIRKTQLFLEFIKGCENENKNYLAVMDAINNQQ